MKTNLLKLLNAQEIDLEIDRLIKSKKEYPDQIETLKKEIEDLKNAVDDTEARILDNQKNRRLIEEEIAAERDTLSRKEKRLLETKTNKEYTAVQHEIEKARERIDHLETEDLELMTEFDTLNPQKDELQEKYDVTVKVNTTRIKEIQKRFDSIESDIAKLEKKRESNLAEVNKRSLAVYNRLRKGKSGIAVATVNQSKLSCRGCFKQLPPQKVLEVRRGEHMIFCEFCGRILVWDPREESK
jgi:predicted  nucleic acid-binding Zn-ribbon protein